ncbi:UDP-2,3-diacylglucosamine pyrophosphatase [Litorimonas cladophorae]|uniref:UDP-2,3-diacylglucosamine pyrophosphatase n=1 Tax=Litorimonas cladophorae TaxID=1220491 RepID=A0A918KBD5_9PROT|nr:UDP-2,3-diacylglucosamine diphosphatase LpxI [Litorimonas cladophorae]GGX57733.1 UDP-2,3-diacylglucosamine pyrophosphatase [Litorimonas cladophorae]
MRIGLIAGGGKLPKYVEAAALENGTLATLIALDPFVSEGSFEAAQHLRVGQMGKIIKLLKRAKCTHVCFAGVVNRPDFSKVRPDFKAVRNLPGIIRAAGKGDDALMRHMLTLFENEGFEIISPQEVCQDLMLSDGVLGAVPMPEAHRTDALKACEIAAAIGALDIGQGVVVARGVTLAVEAQEGTDAMLSRVASLPIELRGSLTERVGVLAKLVKPTQDTRVDLPTIGPETIRRAAAAGLAGIVAEAGGAFVIDRTQTVRLANEAGLFIAGLPTAK